MTSLYRKIDNYLQKHDSFALIISTILMYAMIFMFFVLNKG